MNITASSDEKIMAALVHGSVFLMFLGPVVPVIIWVSQRKQSKYIQFHALQAMGYQTLIFWLWIVVMILVTVLSFLLLPLSAVLAESASNTPIFPFLFQLPIFIGIFGVIGFSFILGIAGGVACLLGHDFRYPFLGKWLERYLSYDADPETQIIEAQEDNWVAGLCHATAILQLWGVITPLVVWFSQKERSARLRFQSIQALIYQIIALAVYMLGMVVYLTFFMGMFFTLILSGAMGENQLQGPPAFILVIFLCVMVLFWLFIMILMPIYYLLAAVAGICVLRGHHFRYPILGKMIEKRMGISLRSESVS